MTEGTPALTAQLDLIEWLEKHGSEWARWFYSTYSGNTKVAAGGERDMLEGLKGVNQAQTVFVSRDMCAVIEKAAREMPDVPLLR